MMNRTQMVNNFEMLLKQLNNFNTFGEYAETNLAFITGQAASYAQILDSRNYEAFGMYARAKNAAERKLKATKGLNK